MITLRLDPKLERLVGKVAKEHGLTKSELIRQSLRNHLDELENQSPWELGQDLFGKHSSGRGNLSVDRKKLLKQIIEAKRR